MNYPNENYEASLNNAFKSLFDKENLFNIRKDY